MKCFKAVALLLSVLLCSATLFAGSLTVGTPDPSAGNSYPFMSNDSGTNSGLTTDYQQVYQASAFGSGPIIISSLTFNYAAQFGGSPNIIGGTYDVYLSTTSLPVNGLPAMTAPNLGVGGTLVSQFTLLPGGVSGDPSFTVLLQNLFAYTPASGNLLLEIVAFNQDLVPNGSGNGYNQVDLSGTVTSRSVFIPFGYQDADNNGLVTTFDVTATPEPGTVMLLGSGLLGLVSMVRRKFGLNG